MQMASRTSRRIASGFENPHLFPNRENPAAEAKVGQTLCNVVARCEILRLEYFIGACNTCDLGIDGSERWRCVKLS